jgi:hypothetical protein
MVRCNECGRNFPAMPKARTAVTEVDYWKAVNVDHRIAYRFCSFACMVKYLVGIQLIIGRKTGISKPTGGSE